MSFGREIAFLTNRRDRRRFAAMAAFLLFGALLEIAALASIPLFVSLILQQGSSPTEGAGKLFCGAMERFFGENCSTGSRLLAAGGLIIAVNLLRTAWNILGMALQYRFQSNRRIELSRRLLRCYLVAPQSFHDGRNSTELLNSIILECDNVIQGTLSPIFEFIRGGSLVIFVTVMLFCWTPGITAAALAMLGISCTAVLCLRNRRLKRLAAEEQSGREASMTAGQEALDSRIEAAIHGRQAFFDNRFSQAMQNLAMAQGGNMLQIRATWPLLEFLSLAALMLVAALAWVLAGGDISKVAPQLALLAMALVRLRSTSVNLMQSALEFRRYRPSLSKVCEDLRSLENATAQEIAIKDSVPPMDFKQAITLDNLSVTYPGTSRPALENLSLDIPAGSSIAIVGPTGCGKSTLLRAILGLLTPTNGEILIDGAPMHQSLTAWWHTVGYVPQKPFMMDASLADNITFGAEEGTSKTDNLRNALKIAQLTQLISELPEGLDTRLGERGQRFSGGQCQRIALARALFRAPKVLVLDEATSALDKVTENAFAQALGDLPQGTTTIVVTHRLGNLDSYDKVLFLNEGHMEAFGTFSELMEKSARFKDFATGTQCKQV